VIFCKTKMTKVTFDHTIILRICYFLYYLIGQLFFVKLKNSFSVF